MLPVDPTWGHIAFKLSRDTRPGLCLANSPLKTSSWRSSACTLWPALQLSSSCFHSAWRSPAHGGSSAYMTRSPLRTRSEDTGHVSGHTHHMRNVTLVTHQMRNDEKRNSGHRTSELHRSQWPQNKSQWQYSANDLLLAEGQWRRSATSHSNRHSPTPVSYIGAKMSQRLPSPPSLICIHPGRDRVQWKPSYSDTPNFDLKSLHTRMFF